jgi:hypothetical protein
MAQSYTLGEAAKILAEGKDFEAVGDLHRRFPIFTHKLMNAMSGDKDAVVEFMSYIPDYVNPRKVEKVITADPVEQPEEDAEAEPEPQPDKEKPTPKKRRARKADEEAESESEAEADEEQNDGKYAGKNAMELFKECKKRGIKAAPKKPVKYYIELLEKDDAAVEADTADSNDDDDDWDI